jgi:FkbM family methyltransferase
MRVLLVIAFVALACLAALRFYPGLVLLFKSDLKSRSPYCSVWNAVADARVELGQQEDAERIARASHIVSREGALTLWATPQGEYWIPSSDDRVLPILLAQSDRKIYGDRDRGVRPGDIVLDCGAYVGTYARLALSSGAKLVVAIEPSPDSVECLRRNLAREIADGRVVVYPKGVWDSETTLTLLVNPANTAGNGFVEGINAIAGIPVTTIEKLVAELKLPRVDFIKADVKGATERLLRGGSAVIARDRPRIALSTEEPIDDAGAIAALVKKIQPAYEMKGGPCLTGDGGIYTDVLFFR